MYLLLIARSQRRRFNSQDIVDDPVAASIYRAKRGQRPDIGSGPGVCGVQPARESKRSLEILACVYDDRSHSECPTSGLAIGTRTLGDKHATHKAAFRGLEAKVVELEIRWSVFWYRVV
jgi:hypothetical protein